MYNFLSLRKILNFSQADFLPHDRKVQNKLYSKLYEKRKMSLHPMVPGTGIC